MHGRASAQAWSKKGGLCCPSCPPVTWGLSSSGWLLHGLFPPLGFPERLRGDRSLKPGAEAHPPNRDPSTPHQGLHPFQQGERPSPSAEAHPPLQRCRSPAKAQPPCGGPVPGSPAEVQHPHSKQCFTYPYKPQALQGVRRKGLGSHSRQCGPSQVQEPILGS